MARQETAFCDAVHSVGVSVIWIAERVKGSGRGRERAERTSSVSTCCISPTVSPLTPVSDLTDISVSVSAIDW